MLTSLRRIATVLFCLLAGIAAAILEQRMEILAPFFIGGAAVILVCIVIRSNFLGGLYLYALANLITVCVLRLN